MMRHNALDVTIHYFTLSTSSLTLHMISNPIISSSVMRFCQGCGHGTGNDAPLTKCRHCASMFTSGLLSQSLFPLSLSDSLRSFSRVLISCAYLFISMLQIRPPFVDFVDAVAAFYPQHHIPTHTHTRTINTITSLINLSDCCLAHRFMATSCSKTSILSSLSISRWRALVSSNHRRPTH